MITLRRSSARLLAFFKQDPNFGGIDLSTSIRQEGAESGAVAVEYIFGMPALHRYEQYDCTVAGWIWPSKAQTLALY